MKMKLLLLLLLFFAGCSKPDYQNVLLITVDGLRADAPGCYGGGAQTPALDRLAADGVRFDRLMTPVPLTLPANASLLSGANPPEHGLHINGSGSLPPAIASVAESFSEAKYATAAFVTSPHLAAIHGLDRGFGLYHAPPVPDAAQSLALYVPLALAADPGNERLETPAPEWSDAEASRRFGLWLEGLKPGAPWFAWLQFSGTALPRRAAGGTIMDANDAAGYLRAVAEVDAAVNAALERLESVPGAAKTIVMVTASSGESLGEKDEYGHGLLLNVATRRVPGVLRLPEKRCAGARLPFSVSLTQIAPTLLDLANVAPGRVQAANWSYMRWIEPAKPIAVPNMPARFYTPCRSDSLVPLLYGYHQGSDAAVYCESEYGYALLRWQPQYALQVGNWVYIRRGSPELYDLKDDAGEMANLAQMLPDSVQRLDVRLDNLISLMARRPAVDVSASNAAWRAMEALGASGRQPDAARGEQGRLRVRDAEDQGSNNFPPLDMELAMRVFRLYPLLAASNRTDEVMNTLEECIEASPGTARFYVWRAALNSADSNAVSAVVADLAQAAAIEPQNAMVAALLGKAYFAQGDVAAALAQLRQARRHDAKNAIVADLLPQVLLAAANNATKSDDVGEALQLVEELLTLQPTLENRMWRVRLLMARQRNTQARQELRNILYANPDYFPARDLLERMR